EISVNTADQCKSGRRAGVGCFYQSALPERIFMSTHGLLKALNDSKRYLAIVQKKELGKSEAEWLLETSFSRFARYYSSRFIDYRKSVAQAVDVARVQVRWRG